MLAQITHHSFATTGHEAVSVALWALVTNWQQPQQAVVTATMCGGHSSAVGQMAGALAGALHGSRWVPADWRQALEEGEGQQGLAAVVDVAERLAQLDVTNTPAQRQ